MLRDIDHILEFVDILLYNLMDMQLNGVRAGVPTFFSRSRPLFYTCLATAHECVCHQTLTRVFDFYITFQKAILKH